MIDIRTKLIAALGLTLGIIGAIGIAHHQGVTTGRAQVQADWNRAKLASAGATNQAVAAAIARNNADHLVDLQLTHRVLDEYETKLAASNAAVAAARADADHWRLRYRPDAAGGRPAAPGTAAGAIVADAGRGDRIGDGAGEIELPAALAGRLFDIAADADREIGACRAKVQGLQDWARGHGFYGPQVVKDYP